MAKAMKLIRDVYHAFPKPPTTNFTYRSFAVKPYSLLPPSPVIFDIGSKSAGGSYAFGDPPPGARLVCVDIAGGPGVDLVADAHDMPMVADGTVDCVVTISTLEHVRYPGKVIDEIFRILKPGGILYVNVPFVFPFHADPDDFYRFSMKGLEILCEKFERLDGGHTSAFTLAALQIRNALSAGQVGLLAARSTPACTGRHPAGGVLSRLAGGRLLRACKLSS